MNENIRNDIEEYAYHMRKHALKMSYAAKDHAVHFGGTMSLIDILAVLYAKILRLDKANPMWPDRDRFILSKGHGVVGLYAALVEFGYISIDDMNKFEQDDSYLMGHPIYKPEHGIEFTNGSLGMGLSLGIGTAIAAKKNNKTYRTYVLMGDGELDEGSVWEAFMAAAHFKLDNLCAIVDRNGLQLGGYTKDIMAHGDLYKKLKSFDWNVLETDGHDVIKLYRAFSDIPQNHKPSVIIADTIKGKGFSFAENTNAWHHSVMTTDQYKKACNELEEDYYGNK